MEGQSINRSSMKFNIPARTLRDWMKRLNIKSVFTHSNGGQGQGHQPSCRTSTEDQSEDGKSSSCGSVQEEYEDDEVPGITSNLAVAFPGMVTPPSLASLVPKAAASEDEEDEEEEEGLKIAE